MKYAIVEQGGKQFKVVEGETFDVDRLPLEAGKKFVLDRVLLLADGEDVSVGTPTIKGLKVNATVLEHFKGPKIVVFKYSPRKRYRVRGGHRQQYTRLMVDAIGKASAAAKSEKAEKEKPAAKKKAAVKSSKKAEKKETTAKKTAAKKTAARAKSAKKTSTQKTTAKKSTAKKSAAKKSTAKKSTAKKSAAKKSTAKKSTSKKSSSKKTSSSKTKKK